MFAFTETIQINAPSETVWNTLQDIETWWPPSNPEHDSIERLDGRGNGVGARLRIREKVAGIPGEATGVITHLTPGTEVTWHANSARYRLLGATVTISEGVTWRVEADRDPERCRLSAHVWANFPQPHLARSSPGRSSTCSTASPKTADTPAASSTTSRGPSSPTQTGRSASAT